MKRGRSESTGVLVLTGTPGTGKKSVAPLLARLLDVRLIELNQFALSQIPGRKKASEALVDVAALRSRLLKTDLSNSLVFGHLAPEVLRDGEADFVAVLRCQPVTLKKRLIARGYPGQKVLENVEAELIGVVLDSSVRAFGPTAVHEYDTTRSRPEAVAKRIADDYKAKAVQEGAWTDWTLDYDSSTRLRSLLSSPRTEPAST